MNTSKKQINYNFIITLCVCFLFFTSCKTKQIATESVVLNTSKTTLNDYSIQIAKQQFETVYFNSSINYSSSSENQNLAADIKIDYNKTIWISVKAMGFPVARALITPTEVKYYEKINRTFFEGNFTVLSNFLGTDVDFYKLQNLLLGRSIIDLKKNKPLEKEGVFLNTLKDGFTLETAFNASNKLLLKQTITQKSNSNSFKTHYTAFTEEENQPFPSQFVLLAETKQKMQIAFETKK